MDSITTMTARQCRLQEWTEQIKSCKNRPQGTSVEEWCSLQGITKANYYYRLRRVRMACLQEISKNHSDSAQVMAQVPEHLLEKSMASSEIKPGTLTIQIRDIEKNEQPGFRLVRQSESFRLFDMQSG